MEWLFDAHDFSTRDRCGFWTYELIVVYIISNATIAFAYYVIPIYLFIFYKKRKDLILSPLAVLMFTCFIALCGSTHVCNVLAFYWPTYRFFSLLDCLTALASVSTAMILPLISKRIMQLPTVEQHDEIVSLLYLEIESAQEARESAVASAKLLEMKVEQLTDLLQHRAWTMTTKENLADLKRQLTNLKE